MTLIVCDPVINLGIHVSFVSLRDFGAVQWGTGVMLPVGRPGSVQYNMLLQSVYASSNYITVLATVNHYFGF